MHHLYFDKKRCFLHHIWSQTLYHLYFLFLFWENPKLNNACTDIYITCSLQSAFNVINNIVLLHFWECNTLFRTKLLLTINYNISRILHISKIYVPTVVSQEINHHENCKWLATLFDVNVKQNSDVPCNTMVYNYRFLWRRIIVRNKFIRILFWICYFYTCVSYILSY